MKLELAQAKALMIVAAVSSRWSSYWSGSVGDELSEDRIIKETSELITAALLEAASSPKVQPKSEPDGTPVTFSDEEKSERGISDSELERLANEYAGRFPPETIENSRSYYGFINGFRKALEMTAAGAAAVNAQSSSRAPRGKE
jgi:hypothetical protein